MTVNAITDTKKGRTGIAPTYLHTTHSFNDWIRKTTTPRFTVHILFLDSFTDAIETV